MSRVMDQLPAKRFGSVIRFPERLVSEYVRTSRAGHAKIFSIGIFFYPSQCNACGLSLIHHLAASVCAFSVRLTLINLSYTVRQWIPPLKVSPELGSFFKDYSKSQWQAKRSVVSALELCHYNSVSVCLGG